MSFITDIETKPGKGGRYWCEYQQSGIYRCHVCALEDKDFELNPVRNNIYIKH